MRRTVSRVLLAKLPFAAAQARPWRRWKRGGNVVASVALGHTRGRGGGEVCPAQTVACFTTLATDSSRQAVPRRVRSALWFRVAAIPRKVAPWLRNRWISDKAEPRRIDFRNPIVRDDDVANRISRVFVEKRLVIHHGVCRFGFSQYFHYLVARHPYFDGGPPLRISSNSSARVGQRRER
jgi:hypothetical protein